MGAGHLNSALREVLQRAELGGRAEVFSRRETLRWPPGALAALLGSGILLPEDRAEEIEYGGCERGCTITADFSPTAVRGGAKCLHRCIHGCGLVEVAPEEFNRWRFDLLGLARAVAVATRASGTPAVDTPSRLAVVGTVGAKGSVRELFIGVGLGRDDAQTTLRHADRLRASAAPLVLCAGRVPDPQVWHGMRPATALLTEHAQLGPGGLVLDIQPLLLMATQPHAGSRSTEWITVGEGAKRLHKDLKSLKLGAANTRVSRAADAGEIKNNGERGAARRIDAVSFDAWRLKQRDADMDRDDPAKPVRRGRRKLAGGFGGGL